MPHPARRAYPIVIGVLALLLTGARLSFPDLDHGDEFTDANVLNAGGNFVRFGFIECRFLPMYEPQATAPRDLYTHYPPLPDIVNGLLRWVFRTDSLLFFRVVSVLVSLLGLAFWALFIRRVTRSATLAFLAALFYLCNPLFLFGLDSLHESSYSECQRSLVFYLTARFVDASPGRQRTLVGWALVLALGIGAAITFEYIVYLTLFFALFAIHFVEPARRLPWKALVPVVLAPVVAFALHVLQDIWYFGSVGAAFADLRNIMVERMLHSRDAPGSVITPGIWLNEVLLRNIRLTFIFDYLVLAALLIASFLAYRALGAKTRREVARHSRLLLILFACGLTWYLIFPSHSWAHTYLFFLARHLLPAAALAFALAACVLFAFVRERLGSNRVLRGLVWAMVAFVAWKGIDDSQLPLRGEEIRASREFVTFRECLTHLKGVAGEQATVGVNFFRFPFIRYYTHRHVVAAFTPGMLAEQQPLPAYFIYIPYDNQDTRDLLEFLKQRYVPLFECRSGAFTSMFLELKR